MGIMDYIAKTGADLLTPPQASPVFQNQTPLQQSMGRPQVQFSQPSAATMATTMPSGMMTMASTTPQVQQQFAMPRSSGMPTPPRATPRMPDMGGAGVRMTPEQLAEQAAKAVKIEQERPEIAAEPGFMKTVSDFFGDRENMLRLALAFNSMTLRPDTGLASVIGSELEDIRAQKVAGKTVPAIVSFLRSKGYEEYAKVVESNPAMAKTVYEQVIQKELKPDAAQKTSSPQQDQQGRYFVTVSDASGSVRTEYLTDTSGQVITGDTPKSRADAEIAAAKIKSQDATGQKMSEEALKQAGSLGTKIRLYQDALVQLDEGAGTGPIESLLPTFKAATAQLESLANQLGITVINSATFGALSESELRLALSTELPIGLDEPALRVYIEEKITATSKLRQEMLKKSYDMSAMGYQDYIKQQRKEAEENQKYLMPPQGVSMQLWSSMTLSEKKEFERLGQ
jgi:hypothetical protein